MELAETAAETDEAILLRARAGDRGAFDDLVRRHERRAIAVAIGLLRNRGAAEEAAQEAFVRAFERLGTIRDLTRFRPWFAGILYRVCWESRRAPHVRLQVQALSLRPRSDAAARVVEEALALNDDHRDVLILIYLDGLSFAEAAQVLGITESNAKVRAHRARRILRDQLRRKGVLP